MLRIGFGWRVEAIALHRAPCESQSVIQPVVGLEYTNTLALRDPLGPLLREIEGETLEANAPGDSTQHAPPVPHHEIVIHADIGHGAARIALATGPSEELAIDSGRLVALGGDDMEPPHLCNACAQFDVGPPAGHVSRDRDAPGFARAGDDLRFFFMAYRIENLVRDAILRQQLAEVFAVADAARADENRSARLVDESNFVHHGVPLARVISMHAIGVE